MRYALALLLLLPLPAFADSITAQLTLKSFPAPWEPQIHVQLDAIITLEPSPGPFWHSFYQAFVPNAHGYVITSLVGTFNGMPAELFVIPTPLMDRGGR